MGNEANIEELAGIRVLVVEDNYFVATSVAQILESVGAVVIGTLGNLEEGLAFLEQGQPIDVALLDVNLAGEMTYPIADILKSRHVPYVLATGYDTSTVDPKYRNAWMCMKPFNYASLIGTLQKALAAPAT